MSIPNGGFRIVYDEDSELWHVYNKKYSFIARDQKEAMLLCRMLQASIDYTKIARVEVIEPGGRAYVGYHKVYSTQVQDNGTTLKIFTHKSKPYRWWRNLQETDPECGE